MNDHTDEFVERLRAEQEIKSVLQRYCRGVDRRDFELVRSTYYPDAHDAHGAYNGGVDGLIDWMTRRHESVAQSMHMLGNCLIEWHGSQADVETYCVTYQRLAADGAASTADVGLTVGGSGQQTQVRCRYLDKFERRAGEWRIANRAVVYESLLLENTVEESPFAPNMLLATRSKDDPLYSIFV